MTTTRSGEPRPAGGLQILANAVALLIGYYSVISLWLSVQHLGQLRALFAELGGRPPTASLWLADAGGLLARHALESVLTLTLLFVVILWLVMRGRRRRGLGLLKTHNALWTAPVVWMVTSMVGQAMAHLAYRPMFDVISIIR